MAKSLSSPLISVANNIVSLNARSKRSLPRFVNEFKSFSSFITTERAELDRLKLPEKRKIKALSNLNIASNFGSPGGLLNSLASGAMDVAGFLGNMFPSEGKLGKPKKPAGKPPKPTVKGPALKFGGLRSIGIVNAIFAGLDFATGLQEGESVGKAAAGAGGSLAGSLLGGAIGTALIPFPPLGFVVGSAIGGMAGGWLGDRAHEVGEKTFKQKQEEKIKSQEAKQKAEASKVSYDGLTEGFEDAVKKFEKFVHGSFISMVNAAAAAAGEEGMPLEYGDPMPEMSGTEATGEYQDVVATGGKLPSKSIITSRFGWRWGRQHRGTDYGEPTGTPISVIQPGKVKYAGWDDRAGNFVEINHTDGSMTRYLHLDKPANVKTGQAIEPGTVIGYVGSTGGSTGPHLHFEYAPPGKGSIDSAPYADKYFRFGGNVKVKPKASASGKTGAEGTTAVLMAGTNDTDANKAAENIKRSIKDLQAKGYKVVVVPPSQQQGSPYATIGAAIEKASKEMGATVDKKTYKGQGDQNPFAHLDKQSVQSLKQSYPGAKFIGDSNAENFQGSMNYRGQDSNYIMQQISKMQNAKPVVPVGGEDLDIFSMTPEQRAQFEAYINPAPSLKPPDVNAYPSYNKPGQSSVVLMPIALPTSGGGGSAPVVISGGGGGAQIIKSPGPSPSEVVNSLMKTMLLTNLSGS
jgi:murein DD-endopeptidase MepM/ murein hydrolase activator NlpD